MSNVYDWFQERLEIQAIADDITSKYVPPHVNIFYCLGGITFTCFLVQVATGFAMTFYYRPSVVDAFASVEYIMTTLFSFLYTLYSRLTKPIYYNARNLYNLGFKTIESFNDSSIEQIMLALIKSNQKYNKL